MRRLCQDITVRLPEFRHIDMSRVALRGCQTRRAGRYGVQASLTPMRFKDGAVQTIRRGRPYRVRPIHDRAGREMLYLLSFYLPRFLDLSYDEKLATVCHELWHIGPTFNGDIRRHEHGRCYAHGPSEKQFHAAMHVLAQRWLALDPPAELHALLRHNFQAIRGRHGAVLAARLPTPRLIPVPAPNAAQN
ncbi:MAG: hypothetical protein JSS27_19560 [Planctomycetes bacterium]|nr:hypothetical protein [Planctomycetota bacterium]